jgi:ubiquinone/menaquinone biosynthesis C-methylase UbiE
MVDLSERSKEEEIMDDLSDSSESLFRALKELDIINKWLGGNAVTLSAVKKFIKKSPQKVWHIADLGCGSGEMLKRIVDIARQNKIKVHCYGFDANPHVISYATKHCSSYPEISFHAENILGEGFKARNFDLMLCTLFLHHFNEDTLVKLFNQFKLQATSLIINDLHRHWFAYYSIKWITKLFSRSSMVQNDACLWRAFKKADLTNILQKAQIVHYELKWRWAFRWKLIV